MDPPLAMDPGVHEGNGHYQEAERTRCGPFVGAMLVKSISMVMRQMAMPEPMARLRQPQQYILPRRPMV